MAKYKFTYFLNTACAERRPTTREDLKEDWIVEQREYPTDLEAFEYMYLKVYDGDEDYLYDLYEDLPDQDDLTKIEAIKDDFDCADIGDGSIIVISIKGPGQTYDSGYTKSDFRDLDESKKLNEGINGKVKLSDIFDNIWENCDSILADDFYKGLKSKMNKKGEIDLSDAEIQLFIRDYLELREKDYQYDLLKQVLEPYYDHQYDLKAERKLEKKPAEKLSITEATVNALLEG